MPNHIFSKKFTIIVETLLLHQSAKPEQETGFASPFYKYNVIYTLTQAGNKDEASIERD